MLLEVLATACAERQASGQPLWILIDIPAAGIAPLPAA
jgi:hypothetical protein